jgi:hypothetical protein
MDMTELVRLLEAGEVIARPPGRPAAAASCRPREWVEGLGHRSGRGRGAI